MMLQLRTWLTDNRSRKLYARRNVATGDCRKTSVWQSTCGCSMMIDGRAQINQVNSSKSEAISVEAVFRIIRTLAGRCSYRPVPEEIER